MNDNNLKKRIEKIITLLSKELYEREDTISVVLLGALAEESIFLYGPPGTAKSLIARRVSLIFEKQNYFEYLMQKFSTPEEIFGPVSIAELKKDNYKRITENYLSQSNIAFLDEIWKANPAILNTLLTILNERIFKNGKEIENTDLKVIISASNETPPKNQGLEAIYDRFLIRIQTLPIIDRANFELLLNSNKVKDNIEITKKITEEELKQWKEEIKKVNLSKETLNIIHIIKSKLEEQAKELDIYISDRRWFRTAYLLRTSAYFCGRKETNLSDLLLLKYVLWSTLENKKVIDEVVENTIRENGYIFDVSLSKFDRKKDDLDKSISEELFYSDDIYKTKKINNKEYFHVKDNFKERYYNNRSVDFEFYIDKKYLGTNEDFNPIDKNGNKLSNITCDFRGNKSCLIHIYDYVSKEFSPELLYHKGDKNENVNEILVNGLLDNAKDLIIDVQSKINSLNSFINKLKKEIYNPFVSKKDLEIPLDGLNKLMEDLKLKKIDCERIKKIIK